MTRKKAFWLSFACTLGVLIPIYAAALFFGTAHLGSPEAAVAGEGVGIAVFAACWPLVATFRVLPFRDAHLVFRSSEEAAASSGAEPAGSATEAAGAASSAGAAASAVGAEAADCVAAEPSATELLLPQAAKLPSIISASVAEARRFQRFVFMLVSSFLY